MEKKVLIAGIGGGAGKVLNLICENKPAPWYDLVYIDADRSDLENSPIEHKVFIDAQALNSTVVSTSIDEDGSLSSVKEKIAAQLKSSGLILVIACLGRGAATEGVQLLSRIINEENLLAFFFVTLPFSFEGKNQCKVAENALATLRKSADIVIVTRNDLLFSQIPAGKNAAETFGYANTILADGLIGIAELIRCRHGMIPVDIASIRSVFKHKEAICSFGIGKIDRDDNCDGIIENLLESPMLGGLDFVKKANVIIAILIGGENMQFESLTKCLNGLNNLLEPETKAIYGANSIADKNGQLQITLLTLHYPDNNEEFIDSSPRKSRESPLLTRSKSRDSADVAPDIPTQLSLPFYEDNFSLGIFSGTAATMFNDQNLDIPTFQRLGIRIDLAEE